MFDQTNIQLLLFCSQITILFIHQVNIAGNPELSQRGDRGVNGGFIFLEYGNPIDEVKNMKSRLLS